MKSTNYNSINYSNESTKNFFAEETSTFKKGRYFLVAFVIFCVVILTTLDFSSDSASSDAISKSMEMAASVSEGNLCLTYDEACTLGENGTCPVCTATVNTNQRVRRNIYSLSMEEWKDITDAMWVMKTIPADQGKLRFGPSYRDYDYFHAKHISQASDVRGDRSQTNIIFNAWHACISLEFENSLMAINPEIPAMAYWNWNESDKNAFNDTYFGSSPGTGPDYEVIDGAFAWWPVSDMDATIWQALYYPYMRNASGIEYTGNTMGGKFRMQQACDSQDHMVRYGEIYKGWKHGTTGPIDCTHHGLFPWYKYHQCIDFKYTNTTGNGEEGNYHKSVHLDVGGTMNFDFYDCVSLKNYSYGDFDVGAYSITDPIFFFHHINMDREMHAWQSLNSETAICYYGFTYDGYCCNNVGERDEDCVDLGLTDYLSEYWCFTDYDLGIYIHDDPNTCWKVYEAICHLSFNTAPYTYDNYLTW